MQDTLARPAREPTVQSVDRAVTILEILGRQGEAGVSEVAGPLGVHNSTASRQLPVRQRRGLTEQVGERGRYRLGFRILLLANATAAHLDLTQLSRASCEWLAAEVGETVNVAVIEGDAAVNLGQVLGPASISSHNWIGHRTPLHATSSGKVLLAHLPAAERAERLARPLQSYTDATITDPGRLVGLLDQVAEAGWAGAFEELEVGLNAVAAPIRSFDGDVVAALSVSGPSYRMTREAACEVATSVVKAADEISAQLGHAPAT
ncbi:MAG: IclR family transcriptional regulator [Acidimicrobiales bacterium]